MTPDLLNPVFTRHPRRNTISGIVGDIIAGVTTFAAHSLAAVPEAKQALSPLFETGHEYTVLSIDIISAVPTLSLLTLLATAAKD